MIAECRGQGWEEAAAAFGRDVLHLSKLDATTVLDWVRGAGESVDKKGRLEQALKIFSGQMSLDEVYDGGYYQLFERLTRYLDFENADKTSNHVERENREFRKRQKGHYRMRSRASIRALLNLLHVRKPVPGVPTKLKPRTTQATQEEKQVA